MSVEGFSDYKSLWKTIKISSYRLESHWRECRWGGVTKIESKVLSVLSLSLLVMVNVLYAYQSKYRLTTGPTMYNVVGVRSFYRLDYFVLLSFWVEGSNLQYSLVFLTFEKSFSELIRVLFDWTWSCEFTVSYFPLGFIKSFIDVSSGTNLLSKDSGLLLLIRLSIPLSSPCKSSEKRNSITDTRVRFRNFLILG